MIKKDITFTNYNDVEVTKSFYFNYTKLESVEIEMEYGDLEATIEQLTETRDAKTAYGIFKEIVLGAVGVKSIDGMEFVKNDEIRSSFANSPAMSVLIWDFLENPDEAGDFLEGMLPAKDVAAGKARVERERLEAALASHVAPQDRQKPAAQLDTADPVLDTSDAVEIEKTDEDILAADISTLNNDELARLIELRRVQSNNA